MLHQFKMYLFRHELKVIGDKVIKQFEEAREIILKEIDNYKSNIEELENKLNERETYISKLEKDYNNLSVKADILQSKLSELEEDSKKVLPYKSKRVNKDLVSEIFGDGE